MLRDPISIWGLTSDLTSAIARTVNIMTGKPFEQTNIELNIYIYTTIIKWKAFYHHNSQRHT